MAELVEKWKSGKGYEILHETNGGNRGLYFLVSILWGDSHEKDQ